MFCLLRKFMFWETFFFSRKKKFSKIDNFSNAKV